MQGKAFIEALQASGTGKTKVAPLKKHLATNPRATGADLLEVLVSIGAGEGTVAKANDLLSGKPVEDVRHDAAADFEAAKRQFELQKTSFDEHVKRVEKAQQAEWKKIETAKKQVAEAEAKVLADMESLTGSGKAEGNQEVAGKQQTK